MDIQFFPAAGNGQISRTLLVILGDFKDFPSGSPNDYESVSIHLAAGDRTVSGPFPEGQRSPGRIFSLIHLHPNSSSLRFFRLKQGRTLSLCGLCFVPTRSIFSPDFPDPGFCR
jgi:hypothetical protein